MFDYWRRVSRRAWRRSLELARLESWERVLVFLIGLLVPAFSVWFWVGKDAATTIRLLASLGASFLIIATMFGWSLLKLPAIMEAEAAEERARLTAQIETQALRTQRREELAAYLAQGTHFRELVRMAFDSDQAAPQEEANQWFVGALLHNNVMDSLVESVVIDGLYAQTDAPAVSHDKLASLQCIAEAAGFAGCLV